MKQVKLFFTIWVSISVMIYLVFSLCNWTFVIPDWDSGWNAMMAALMILSAVPSGAIVDGLNK